MVDAKKASVFALRFRRGATLAGTRDPGNTKDFADATGLDHAVGNAADSATGDGAPVPACDKLLSPGEAFERMLDAADAAKEAGKAVNPFSGNTTLGCVITNATLTKAQATKVSAMVHDAYAHAIRPVHTTNDGDTIFTVATGEVAPDLTAGDSQAIVDTVGVLGTHAMEQAIRSAVMHAEPLCGVPTAL